MLSSVLRFIVGFRGQRRPALASVAVTSWLELERLQRSERRVYRQMRGRWERDETFCQEQGWEECFRKVIEQLE